MRVLALLCVLLGLLAFATGSSHTVPIHHSKVNHRIHELFDLMLKDALGTSGGNNKKCVTCTLVVGLVEQLALDNSVSLSVAGSDLCGDILAGPLHPLQSVCTLILDGLLPSIQADFAAGKSPDYSCHTTLKMCTGVDQCQLFTQWPPAASEQTGKAKHNFARVTTWALHQIAKDAPTNAKTPTAPNGHHLPLVDADGDRKAPSQGYRGSQWHGADCNDKDATVYPGRAQTTYGPDVDHNCNGIFGTDPNGNSYEQMYCNVTQRGLIALGDSATAHFSIPPMWLNPPSMNNGTYTDLIPLALSELDWPWCSWSTGHQNNSWCPVYQETQLPLNSIYQRMKARNKCIHRDFQNIGVNGGDSNNINPTKGGYLGDFARSQGGVDQPVTVFYALIGNDVCGHRADYTTPEVFFNNTMTNFQYLDSRLPAGSDVIAVGLVDGRVLYNTMSTLIHPVGTTYAAFYDYLNCLQISPCFGWMNSNETIRNQTSDAAFALNAVYQNITQNYNNFKNFKVNYVFPDFNALISGWVQQGNKASDLIEHADGFHPSQAGNMLLAELLWQFIEQNAPSAMGELNPNNDAITALFGDQGGYGN